MDDFIWCKVVFGDVVECIVLWVCMCENVFIEVQLCVFGIIVESWDDGICDGLFLGYVCWVCGCMVGYCFGDIGFGEIVVFVMLFEYEGVGIGKWLLWCVIDDFVVNGFMLLFFGCLIDFVLCLYGFYCYFGWILIGELDDVGDEIFMFQVGQCG